MTKIAVWMEIFQSPSVMRNIFQNGTYNKDPLRRLTNYLLNLREACAHRIRVK